MSTGPAFSFFIPGEDGRVVPGSPLWRLPLSGKSSGFLKNVQAPDAVKGSDPTIGDYFTSARFFLENDSILARALQGENDPISRVELFLEKHGAFYHPMRVKVWQESGRSVDLVLNGAVSRQGLSLIKKEYKLLTGFDNHLSTGYTPRVFAAGIQPLEIGNIENKTSGKYNLEKRKVGFFLGEWFEGFREFHISILDNEPQIAVWASNGDIDYLTLENASIIYEQIAYILTLYYNMDTGEQVIAWHHAAGDFVVNLGAEGFPVKLITVRGYEALMELDPETGPGEMILPSLLFFFLNLTLRMQIDRLDGTGRAVFMGEQVLNATIKGFLRGLDDKSDPPLTLETGGIKGPEEIVRLKDIFIDFLAGFSQEQIQGGLENLVDAWPENASERTMAGVHLRSHSTLVHSVFKNM